MFKGTTSSGFAFELNEDVLDDYELLESLRKLDKGDGEYAVDVVEQLLGEEQKERLKKHLRNENGKVSAKKLMEEIGEIFNACNPVKN